MAVRTKSSPRSAETIKPWMEPELLPPSTPEGQLEHIDALGKRIEGYVRFMHKVGKMSGVSAEAKDRAVALFHQRLSFFEKELGRIQDELQLE